VYVTQLRRLTEFDVADPKSVIEYLYPDFAFEEYIMGSSTPLTNAQESTGFATADFYNNMKTYIFAFACVVTFMIIGKFISLCRYCGSKRLEKLMKDVDRDFFYNGEIETVHFAYL
jgi:hypothetical protein